MSAQLCTWIKKKTSLMEVIKQVFDWHRHWCTSFHVITPCLSHVCVKTFAMYARQWTMMRRTLNNTPRYKTCNDATGHNNAHGSCAPTSMLEHTSPSLLIRACIRRQMLRSWKSRPLHGIIWSPTQQSKGSYIHSFFFLRCISGKLKRQTGLSSYSNE